MIEGPICGDITNLQIMKHFLTLLMALGIWATTNGQSIKLAFGGDTVYVFERTRIDVIDNDDNVFIGRLAGIANSPHAHPDSNQGKNNTFLGSWAGRNNSSGFKNTAIGYGAGSGLVAGSENTHVGVNAGSSFNGNRSTFLGALTGQNSISGANTFAGYAAGLYNMTGSSNTYVGVFSGTESTLGHNNTYVGNRAGRGSIHGGTQTPAGNTFLGSWAGYSIHQGDDNVAVGYRALQSVGDGSGNVALGFLAGQNETGSNKLYIENTNSSDPLIYGEFDNDIVRINGELQVKNQYTFPTTDGAANQILTTDGSGQLSFANDNVIDGDADPFNELIDSVYFNYPFLSIFQAGTPWDVDLGLLYEDSDADPANELQSLSVSGDSLFISGGNGVKMPGGISTAMIDADTDTKVELYEGPTDGVQFTVDNQIIMGVDSRSIQFFNNSGNTLVGEMTGTVNTGASNTFIGKEAGKVNSTGGGNTFVGSSAGIVNTTGSSNTYLGSGAGLFNPSESGNVFIGYQAGYAGIGDNKLVIDNSGTTSPLIYGDFTTNEVGIGGRLGVGIKTPTSPLDVRTSGVISVARFESTENTKVDWYKGGTQKGFVQAFNNNFVVGKEIGGEVGNVQLFNNGHYVSLENDGDVGIGTSAPVSNKLYVESSGSNDAVVSNITYVGSSDLIAVKGTSKPADGYGYGGYFEGGWRGINAIGNGGAAGFTITGVRGEAIGGTGITQGVYGTASGGSVNWAGYFASGNVHVENDLLIGTTSKATGYMLNVDGKIIGEELKIQDSGSWPDYVFEDDYHLMPLDELEQAIGDLGHLPGIPSAKRS